MARDLFGLLGPRAVPPGFEYRDDFISVDHERALVEAMSSVTFETFEMRGVIARRRVACYGESYDGAGAREIPDFLRDLRHRIAEWAGLDAGAFAMALINEYRPGAPIGWHRDAPQYDLVAGVSLLSSCRMKFRPYQPPSATVPAGTRRTATHQQPLERRSAYLMAGASRTAYEHHIPAVSQLRYSITFRTLR